MSTIAAGDDLRLRDALEAFDQGARVLEQAYRELWSARENERRRHEASLAERIRDLGHEIKNPLGGVRGLAALLERELDETGGSARAKRLLHALQGGIDAMQSVLDARLCAPEDAVDAHTLAMETATLARAESDAEGHAIDFVVQCPEGIELPVAPSVFREVLANLVRNAAEATAPQGTVGIRIVSQAEQVTLEVEDDGRGLPGGCVEDLFQRGVSTKGTGRGRGLAIVRELIQEAKGSLRLEPRERGAYARAVFPRRSA
jgi:signal transduction histidine kinase